MHPALRLGLEVPALRADDETDGEMALHVLALEAESAGVGTLWLSEGGAGSIDPVPLAGALAERTSTIALGVLCRPSRGRHPSVLARDATTIDLLSGGRAAVCLLDAGTGPSDLDRLVEAAGLLHRLLTEQEVTAAGRFYEVAELTTRPRPVNASGPPVVAGLESPAVGGQELEGPLIEAGIDAVVVGGYPSDVALARRRIDGSAPAGAAPALLWRGDLPRGPMLDGFRDAGADGLIARLDPSSVRGVGFDAAAVRRLVASLSAAAGPLA